MLEFEVSGHNGYIQRYQHPEWPGLQSGITIGIGYDLGYVSCETFLSDFADLEGPSKHRLAAVCGLKGSAAKAKLASVKDVTVTWEVAIEVFQIRTVPRYAKLLESAMPGVENLQADIQGALWSLVYNRGSQMGTSDRRREMRQIRDAVANGKPELIPAYLRSMIRIWEGTSAERGMQRRRNAEAELVDYGLRKTAQPNKNPLGSRTLKLGSKGKAVKALQEALKARKFDPGSADGVFGPQTAAAVKAFQASIGLLADGVAGPATLKALGS